MNQQPNKETLSFKIGISGTYWDKKPRYSILINDSEIVSGVISGSRDVIEYISFNYDLVEDQEHSLKIRLENKEDTDTLKDPPAGDPYTIVDDMLLNIHNIEIDNIDLETLIWKSSEFVADDGNRPTLKECVNLGWNGTYILKFKSPFYLWLLEN